MDSVYILKPNAPNNNAASPDGFPENMQFSGVNESFRELMALLKKDYLDRTGNLTASVDSNGDLTVVENQTLGFPPQQGMTLAFQAPADGAAAMNFEGVPLVTDRGGKLLGASIQNGGKYQVVYNAAYSAWQILTQLPVSLARQFRQNSSDANLTREDLSGFIQVSPEVGVKAARVLTVTSDLESVWPVGTYIELADIETNTELAKATGTHVALPAGSTYQRFVPIRGLGTTVVDSPTDGSGNAIVINRGTGARIAKLYRVAPAAFTAVHRPVP